MITILKRISAACLLTLLVSLALPGLTGDDVSSSGSASDIPFSAMAATPETATAILGLSDQTSPSAAVYAASPATIAVKHNNTKAEIISKAKLYWHNGFLNTTATRYLSQPRFTAPYAAGSLNPEDIADALKAVKMVRYLAGVPYAQITFAAALNSLSQHGAVLMAASNQFSHSPAKPADMTQEFFDIAYRGCSQANISAGYRSISTSVLSFIADQGLNNLEIAGHRRWILKPGADNFGIGYARYALSSYQGDRISMHVFSGLSAWQVEADTYIAWPAAGDFPVQYLYLGSNPDAAPAAPWSVNLGAPYLAPNRSEVRLVLTRLNDNRTWLFNKDTPQLGTSTGDTGSNHLAVDDAGYGIRKAIIFRPALASLGKIKDGDRFKISLSGIKTLAGAPTTLTYTINFFDLQKAMNCTVTFNSLGGSPAAPIIAGYNTLVAAPAKPVRAGYVFVGWYTSSALTTPWNFETNRVTSSRTLYARWLKSPVGGLAAWSASYNSICLSWTAAAGADYYQIFRSASLTGTYSLIKELPAASVPCFDLARTTGTTYYYKIRALALHGAGKIYSSLSAVASARAIPAAPATLTVVRSGVSSINVSWSAVAGSSGYEVWRASSLAGPFLLARVTASASFANTGLTAGVYYYYKVRAYRLVGTVKVYGAYSAVKYAKPY